MVDIWCMVAVVASVVVQVAAMVARVVVQVAAMVARVVGRQVELGLDLVTDGEGATMLYHAILEHTILDHTIPNHTRTYHTIAKPGGSGGILHALPPPRGGRRQCGRPQ